MTSAISANTPRIGLDPAPAPDQARPAPEGEPLGQVGGPATGAEWAGFRGAPPSEPMPSPADIRGLVEYRRKRREATRQGSALPKLDLGTLRGNPPAPAVVDQILRRVDELMPRIMQEKGLTLTRLFRLDDTMRRGESSPWQKTLVGANTIVAGYIAYQLARQVGGAGDLALLAAALVAGHKLGGAIAYLAHDLIDEYDSFAESFEFQVHHEDPAELGKWDAAKTLANAGRVAAPALGLLAALEPSLGVAATALGFIGTLQLAPLFHKWAHLPPQPKDASRFERFQRKLIKLAQRAGLIVSEEVHGQHHGGRKVGRMTNEPRLAHTESFDVGTGHALGEVNAVFDDLEVSQRLKRAIYLVTKWATGTGVEPHSWTEHPELRIRWGGDGTDQERRAAHRAYRIEQAEGRIQKAKAELAEAAVVLARTGEAQPDPEIRKRAEQKSKSLPGAIQRMEADLERFRAAGSGGGEAAG